MKQPHCGTGGQGGGVREEVAFRGFEGEWKVFQVMV